MKNRVDALSEKHEASFCFWDRTGGKLRLPEENLKQTYVMEGNCRGMKFSTLLGYFRFMCFSIKKMLKAKPDVIHAFRFESLIAAYIYKMIFRGKSVIVYEVADLPSCVHPVGKSRMKRFLSCISSGLEKMMIKKASIVIFT